LPALAGGRATGYNQLQAKTSLKMSGKSRFMLRAIAAFRFAKAAVLIVAGTSVLHLVHGDVGAAAERLVEKFHLNPGNHHLILAIARVSKLSPGHLREIGLASFFYAGLFIIEGTGLWLLKRWGEWVTVVVTSSLLPFEIISVWRHATLPRIVIFVVNVAIVLYLIYLIRRKETPAPNASKG
jgi:uncharacterized membrane protein (DUF2068 family)